MSLHIEETLIDTAIAGSPINETIGSLYPQSRYRINHIVTNALHDFINMKIDWFPLVIIL